MTSRFARRLTAIATLEIGAVLAFVIVVGALAVFGSYVNAIRAEASGTLAGLVDALVSSPAKGDALGAAALARTRGVPEDLIVVLLDGEHRVAIYRRTRVASGIAMTVARRGDPTHDPQAAGPLASPIDGLATAFGLQYVHSRVGRVDVIVKENESALVATAGAFAAPIAAAVVFAFGVGFAIARTLTRQMVRPLLDVQRALERFASGDLTPQPITTDVRGELRELAVAYNGAIDQMERAFDERERANRAIRQFIADAGHQLRTPLTVIRGFIAILRKGDLRTPADRERILDTMNRQSQLMGSLIEKLMLLDAWERDTSASAAEPIDVARLASDVVTPIAEANPGRDVRIDAPGGPLAAIDPSDLTYALTNLVDNALKYTSGAVRVTVGRQADAVTIEVADDGPGMPSGDVVYVFDRFYRGARRDVDGSGLGLAIAKRAVERAAGTIGVTTAPETGTTFAIRLPAARAMRPLPVARA